jgi:hypothetical protein
MHKRLEAITLIGLSLWGLISIFQGATLGMFVSGPGQEKAIIFIDLVYESVFVSVLIALFSSRVASILSLIATLTATIILLGSDSFGHGNSTAMPFICAIALRPLLSACLLFVLPPTGVVIRIASQKRARAMD